MSIPAIQLDEPWVGRVFDEPRRTDIEWVEQQLLSRLIDYARDETKNSALQSVAIEHFPDKPEYYRLTHPVGAALLVFDRAEDTHDPTTVDEVRQERELVWTCAVVIRTLGWSLGGQSTGRDPGAYQVIEALRRALTGFEVPGFTKLVARGARFGKRDSQGGVWYYETSFSHRTIIVNEIEDPPFPPLKRVIIETHAKVKINTVRFVVDQTGAVQLPDTNVLDVSISDPVSHVPLFVGRDYNVDSANGLIMATLRGRLRPGMSVAVGYAVEP